MGKGLRGSIAFCATGWMLFVLFIAFGLAWPVYVERFGVGAFGSALFASFLLGIAPAIIAYYSLGWFPKWAYPRERSPERAKTKDDFTKRTDYNVQHQPSPRSTEIHERATPEMGIVQDILMMRRAINLYFDELYGFKLFREQEAALRALDKPCSSEEQFNTRILYLASLVDGMAIDLLEKNITASRKQGSITILESFLAQEFPNYEKSIIRNLRHIITLRSKRTPIHQDDSQLLHTLHELGLEFPPDWTLLWKQSLALYSDSLKALRDLLKDRYSSMRT